jgi:hypothetical protein
MYQTHVALKQRLIVAGIRKYLLASFDICGKRSSFAFHQSSIGFPCLSALNSKYVQIALVELLFLTNFNFKDVELEVITLACFVSRFQSFTITLLVVPTAIV